MRFYREALLCFQTSPLQIQTLYKVAYLASVLELTILLFYYLSMDDVCVHIFKGELQTNIALYSLFIFGVN